MNVIYIQSDQLRYDGIGAAGNPVVKTPNIDALAASGVRFSTTYCNCPLCCPSRASVLTGVYPSEINCYGNGTPFRGDFLTYPHILRENGVHPYSIGRMDFAPNCNHGFDFTHEGTRHSLDPGEFFREQGYCRNHEVGYRSYCLNTEVFTGEIPDNDCGEMCDFIRNHRSDAEPWYLFLNFFQPHPPYKVPKKYYDLYEGAALALPSMPGGNPDDPHPSDAVDREHWDVETPFSPEEIRERIRIYYAMISWLDDFVGRIMKTVQEIYREDEVCVIFGSDHGEHLGQRGMWEKGRFYDEPSRIPLILWGGGLPKGKVVHTPVSLIDLTPTILDLFHIAPPAYLRGESLLPLCRAEDADSIERRPVFAEYHAHDCKTAQYMVRDAEYKYIYHVGLPAQLYKADTEERYSLAQRPEYRSLCEKYHDLLVKEFGDPEREDVRIKAYQRQALLNFIRNAGKEEVLKQLLDDTGEKGFEKIRDCWNTLIQTEAFS